ncbi:MAG: hypothetical protein E5Y68_04740, partial [Mesorhizobium sp.]
RRSKRRGVTRGGTPQDCGSGGCADVQNVRSAIDFRPRAPTFSGLKSTDLLSSSRFSTMPSIISISGVTKTYATGFKALKEINLDIE